MNNLTLRVITGFVLAIITVAAILWLENRWLMILFTLFVAACSWEWSGFAALNRITRACYSFAFLLLLLFLLTADHTYNWFFNLPFYAHAGIASYYLLLAGVIWWLSCLIWLPFFPAGTKALFSSRIFILTAGILSLLAFWIMLANALLIGNEEYYSRHDILAGFIMVWIADSSAYFIGKKFGRAKLAPDISTGKTWEGAIGGLLCAFVIGLVYFGGIKAANFGLWTPYLFFALGFYIIGDLTVSAFKRNARLKDSGVIFPGHGGVLDRVDGLIAVVPMYLYILTLSA